MAMSLADQLRAQNPGINWDIKGIDRAQELAQWLQQRGVTDISTPKLTWEDYTTPATDGGYSGYAMNESGDSWIPAAPATTERRGYLDFGGVRLGNEGNIHTKNGFLGYIPDKGSKNNNQAFASSTKGDGAVSYQYVLGQDGKIQIVPKWVDTSDNDKILPALALVTGGFGLAGMGPLAGLGEALGTAGTAGSGAIGSSVAGAGADAAANLAAYGGTLTPAEIAATAGIDIGAAGAAGGLGAGAITGGAGLVAPTVGAGAGIGAGLGTAGAAGAAGTAAGSAGFWGSALKIAAPVLGSVAGGLIQSNAAGKAANAQTAAARAAAEAIQKALGPYQQAGTGSLTAQQDLIGLNGAAKQQAAIDAIRTSPQFASLQQLGEGRILANASATGGLRGGNVQGALAQFSPQLLSQLIEQQYQRLGGLTTTGANAAAGVGSAQANAQTQIGSAQAGQALANGSALTNVLGSGLNAFGQYIGQQQAAPGVAPGIAPAITTNTPFGQFQLGGGF